MFPIPWTLNSVFHATRNLQKLYLYVTFFAVLSLLVLFLFRDFSSINFLTNLEWWIYLKAGRYGKGALWRLFFKGLSFWRSRIRVINDDNGACRNLNSSFNSRCLKEFVGLLFLDRIFLLCITSGFTKLK